ncbi:MAG TPA: M48 family metalloprotease [Steroidobacteraceae bacterium]|nr:M48 family metalloprotease [Steroidobacteraceae bacterium]
MSVEHVYPAGPRTVPADLTRPTRAYRTHAWLAMGGLALFVLLYLALAGWFSWTAYRLLASLGHGGDTLWRLVAGVCSAFLAVFMWKALVFVKHRQAIDDIEVTASEQPRLFAFINRLADEAGAPRAHRVFLSPRVNAAVFYDLSVLNLLFPSRKNLEIGLGLVNAISLGELKAVLAHEFGHFGQRSMAVGRWVYIAQQIAAHIIAKRDALDSFLRGLSRVDLRIAWVGWLLSLVVWSIRSLTETVFRVVVLAQRALSREMELQADLVAVSLTGSDALIHALYKLNVADEAWERALAFADSEARDKRTVMDLFAVQKRITEKLRQVLDDPGYGEVAPPPRDKPQEHRVFKTSLAQPPRMWSTHPANSEREQNAKRRYIAAAIDERSAWELFDDVPELKKQMTAHVFRAVQEAADVPLEQSLAKLDEQFGRAFYDRSYRGAYLGRPLALHARQVADLYGPPLRSDYVAAELAALYPQALSEDLARLKALEEEKATLQGLKEGFLTAHGGIIRHRGKDLKRADLQEALDQLQGELDRARETVQSHDRRCRSVHVAAAAQLGPGWEAYLKGLVSILHYAEHSEANLRDAHGALCNTVSVVTADGRVSKGEVRVLLNACAEVHNALRHIYEDEGSKIVLDRTLSRRLKVESWQQALGTFTLPLADEKNVGEWLNAIHSWVASAGSALSALRQAALEQLLLAEAQVSRFVREKMTPAAAPDATKVPDQYPVLVPGSERPRKTKLDLWDRFHVADGLVPTLARLTVACGIIAAVLSVGATVGKTLVNVHNGLARPVTVSIGDASVQVPAFSHAKLTVGGDERYPVRTVTERGDVIEQFDAEIPIGSTESIYNVAGASALVEWTATYGSVGQVPERMIGPLRWTTTGASYIFEEPPETISTSRSSDGGTRDVMAAFGHDNPSGLLSVLQDPKQQAQVIAAHARWDSSEGHYTAYWLALASQGEGFEEIVRARLKLDPEDVLTLRAEQDARRDLRAAVCKRHQTLARARPQSINLQYVAARCIDDEAQRERQFADLYAKAPDNGWLAAAMGYTHAQHARWDDAAAALNVARQRVPSMTERLALDTMRLRRLSSRDGDAQSADLVQQSDTLRYYVALMSGAGLQPGIDMAYHHVARGDVQAALGEKISDPQETARVVRLAAASDGASRELVGQALALPMDRGIDRDSVWTALGLALRERKDPAPYLAVVREEKDDDNVEKILAFIAAARTSANPLDADQLLDGLPLEARGHAYSTALVLLGPRAPAEWRRAADRLLFVPERPYFSVVL